MVKEPPKFISKIYTDDNDRNEKTAIYLKEMLEQERLAWSCKSNHNCLIANGYVRIKEVAN